MIESVDACSLYEYVERQSVRHLRVVKLRKPKWCLAEFAVLLVGMGKPFHETVLVNELDTPATFARIEQGFIFRAFASTYAACVLLFSFGSGFIVFIMAWVDIEIGIIHDISLAGGSDGSIKLRIGHTELGSELARRNEDVVGRYRRVVACRPLCGSMSLPQHLMVVALDCQRHTKVYVLCGSFDVSREILQEICTLPTCRQTKGGMRG